MTASKAQIYQLDTFEIYCGRKKENGTESMQFDSECWLVLYQGRNYCIYVQKQK
jgi:hypothetical protein